MVIALGSWRAGWARSFAVNVTTPKPEEREEGQRHARHDLPDARIRGRVEVAGLHVRDRRDGERREDADDDEHDDALDPRDE